MVEVGREIGTWSSQNYGCIVLLNAGLSAWYLQLGSLASRKHFGSSYKPFLHRTFSIAPLQSHQDGLGPSIQPVLSTEKHLSVQYLHSCCHHTIVNSFKRKKRQTIPHKRARTGTGLR